MFPLFGIWNQWSHSIWNQWSQWVRQDAKYTPYLEHHLEPFLALTMQPCGELCGSVAGFDFLKLWK
jgi:hypothetical protein